MKSISLYLKKKLYTNIQNKGRFTKKMSFNSWFLELLTRAHRRHSIKNKSSIFTLTAISRRLVSRGRGVLSFKKGTARRIYGHPDVRLQTATTRTPIGFALCVAGRREPGERPQRPPRHDRTTLGIPTT